jgi:hypothetical protein
VLEKDAVLGERVEVGGAGIPIAVRTKAVRTRRVERDDHQVE